MSEEIDRILAELDAGFPAVWQMSPIEARAAVAARVLPVDNLDDVRSTEDLVVDGPAGGIPVRVYRPHGDATRPRAGIVYAHGGGFVFGSIDGHDAFCRAMARHCDAIVVSVGYRLAPEHRAPAAAEDCYAVTRWLSDHVEPLRVEGGRIVVAGDSAGGNLAAVVALMARDRSGPALAGQALLYPVIAPDFDTASYRRYAVGYFNTRAAMQWYWEQYAPGGQPSEPAHYVVPSRSANLDGLPPALVVTAGLDPLHSEGEQYARVLRAAGVPVVHRHYPEFFHGFLTMRAMRLADDARAVLWADIRALIEGPNRAAETGNLGANDPVEAST